jgi:chemotaxis protein CheD
VNLIIVDIADLKVTQDPHSVLVTYALGSCVAVIVYDPIRHVGGMIHYMLPQSETSPEKAKERPAMFADTGLPLLFHSMYELGCVKTNLVVKVTGGGSLYDDNGRFCIGQRNYTILRKMFWKVGVMITAEDVGGSKSRTARLFIETGRCTVSSQGEEIEL